MRPALLILLLAACKKDPVTPVGGGDSGVTTPVDSGTTPGEPVPGAAFDRFCGGAEWDASLVEATVTEIPGTYAGALSPDYTLDGTLETTKIIPPHPFWATSLRAAWGESPGTGQFRITPAFGRTYPGGYPDEIEEPDHNLTDPIIMDVPEDAGHGDWVEVDISDRGLFFEPTQHYVLVHEYTEDGGIPLAIGHTSGDEASRSLLFLGGSDEAYGIDGHFRIELGGYFFCQIDEADRYFEETTEAQPFNELVAANATVADINGDGHEDLITISGGPKAFLGDGTGAFAAPDEDPFPEATDATMILFGDIDNDGDQDAFAAVYTSADGDGDGTTLAEGDCNDTDATIEPGKTDTTDGRDNDCDGVADDGTDTSDADADGQTIADGDCDDTLADVSLGALELHDSIDNDCDGLTDEDFPSRILLNDGTGAFTMVPDSGVEVTEPSTAAAFADADGDGLLDLYFGNWLEHYPDDKAVQDRYFTGLGGGEFMDSLEEAGLTLATPLSVYGVEWTDWNNDGWPDLYVGNYHLYNNQLWQNDGTGAFADVAGDVGLDHDDEIGLYPQYPGGHTYGGDFGDIDNDGDMDFYMTNLAHPRTQPWGDPSMFVVNQGGPDFVGENLREEYGFVYDEGDVNAQFADFDNDMDLDLAIASLYQGHYARLYRNDGEAGFTDITYEMGMTVELAISAVWADVDEDGDEDLFVGDGFQAPYMHLFINRVGQDNHWVDIALQGDGTNRDGIGARVSLEAGGITQIRDVQGGGGLGNAQRPKAVHFGLAGNTTIDQVTVHWVGGGTETFTGVGADGRWRLVEGTGTAAAR